MPFVSDFGDGPSGWLFTIGMTLAAVLLLPSWIDYYLATKADMQAERFFPWRCAHHCILGMGIMCSLSVAGVALNPWDQRLFLHLSAANGIFYGSIVFNVFILIVNCRRKVWRWYAVALIASACAGLVLMIGFMEDVTEEGLEQSFTLMRSNYLSYCKGEDVSLHASWRVNVAALFEWILLLSTTALAFHTIHSELRLWQQPSRDLGPNGISAQGLVSVV